MWDTHARTHTNIQTYINTYTRRKANNPNKPFLLFWVFNTWSLTLSSFTMAVYLRSTKVNLFWHQSSMPLSSLCLTREINLTGTIRFAPEICRIGVELSHTLSSKSGSWLQNFVRSFFSSLLSPHLIYLTPYRYVTTLHFSSMRRQLVRTKRLWKDIVVDIFLNCTTWLNALV